MDSITDSTRRKDIALSPKKDIGKTIHLAIETLVGVFIAGGSLFLLDNLPFASFDEGGKYRIVFFLIFFLAPFVLVYMGRKIIQKILPNSSGNIYSTVILLWYGFFFLVWGPLETGFRSEGGNNTFISILLSVAALFATLHLLYKFFPLPNLALLRKLYAGTIFLLIFLSILWTVAGIYY